MLYPIKCYDILIFDVGMMMGYFFKKNLKTFLAILIFSGIILVAMATFLYYKGTFGSHFRYSRTTFHNLPAWDEDDHQQAFIAFQESCKRILKSRQNKSVFTIFPENSNSEAWQNICVATNTISVVNRDTAKKFFETWFEPYAITNNYNPHVLFTGYFLPLIKGSFKQDSHYNVPIYGLPKDLLRVKLALFGKDFHGKKSLVGYLKDKTVYPYFDRKEIMNGAIKKTAKILLWSDSLTDVFFAQIQGSAIVQLSDKSQVVIGYAGDNGRQYTPIGKVLMAKKDFDKKDISMQSIRTWLLQHPSEIISLLNHDASYVFFTILDKKNAVGTEGVPLTGERSLAVDTRLIPLGAPIWLTTKFPTNQAPSMKPFNHLLIAQDTGGAIKGMHGDIFWGAGERAGYIAGKLKSPGKWWILLPRQKADR